MDSQNNAKNEMDRMYRWTRHIYDASRKYYLLGRDKLICKLKCKEGEHICEVGCGTARNLVKMAKTYPQGRFYGIDVSDEMLKTAQKSVEHARLEKRIALSQGFAENFDPKALFGPDTVFSKIVFSYSLSIIPPWKESIDHALEILPVGGEIHIVDFGGMDGLPKWFRQLMFWWLRLFHVYHKPEILEYLKNLVENKQGTLNITTLYNGYAYMAVFKKT
ncbi:MAG: class I SAM-dependent methyltransferase [Alphaproteobacteria bacterium]